MRDEFYNPPPKEGAAVLLTDAPTTFADQPSTSAAANQPSTSATAYDDEFFRNNPGFEKIATYVAQKLHGPTTQRVVAKITAAEKAVALLEQQNADGEDSDVLSEGSPDKDNEMEQ
ncbi:hypothetical protein AAVH_08241 [Aphelenchoides avenae]|nr:hypothetical protein AAVH_08241 [Aphelenchus avenae]